MPEHELALALGARKNGARRLTRTFHGGGENWASCDSDQHRVVTDGRLLLSPPRVSSKLGYLGGYGQLLTHDG